MAAPTDNIADDDLHHFDFDLDRSIREQVVEKLETVKVEIEMVRIAACLFSRQRCAFRWLLSSSSDRSGCCDQPSRQAWPS